MSNNDVAYASLAASQVAMIWLASCPNMQEVLDYDPYDSESRERVRHGEIMAASVGIGLALVLSFAAKSVWPLALTGLTIVALAVMYEHTMQKEI